MCIRDRPYESQAIGGGYVGRHNIPGLGAGFVPENYNPYIVDAVMAVPSHTANVTAVSYTHLRSQKSDGHSERPENTGAGCARQLRR